MKAVLKSSYLNLRKVFLHVPGIFFSQRISPSDIERVTKILFIRIDRIGDLVLSTPALKALKERYPEAELSVLASSANHTLLAGNPNVGRVIIYDSAKGWRGLIRTIKRLREFRFDLAIDPYTDYEVKTALIAFASGARVRVGYRAYGREIFLNLSITIAKTKRHFVDLTLDVLSPLGIEPRATKPEVFLAEEETSNAVKWLKDKGLGNKPLIALHPGAHYESQRWPAAYFAELACLLHNDCVVDLIIFGGPDDENIVRDIVSKIGNDVPTWFGSDLRAFASLLSRCSALVCNNSGPLHVATALNVATVSVMGPTTKHLWMPRGDIHKVLMVDDLSCIGCNGGECKIKSHDCMRLITPAMVCESVMKALEEHPTGKRCFYSPGLL